MPFWVLQRAEAIEDNLIDLEQEAELKEGRIHYGNLELCSRKLKVPIPLGRTRKALLS